jgi:RimJ/RimL family protein N-acetyltransferase
MKYLTHSLQESDAYQLHVARSGRLSDFDIKELCGEITENRYDLVKMKVELGTRNIYSKLNNLPYWYEPYNIIALQERHLSRTEVLPIDQDLVFELYTGEQEGLVREIIADYSSQDTNLYYQSDIFDALLDSNTRQSSSMDYYLSMNNRLDNNRYLFIGKNRGGEPIGICSFIATDDKNAEGVIFGIRPSFRNRKLAGSFLNHSINTLAARGIECFHTEVIYYNFRSLYPHIQAGFRPSGLYLNFILYPLLSHEVYPEKIKTKEIFSELSAYSTRIYKEKFKYSPDSIEIDTVKGNLLALIHNEELKICTLCVTTNFALLRVMTDSNMVYVKALFL